MATRNISMVRWLGMQMLCVAALIAAGTYITVAVGVTPTPWNAAWMLLLPIVAGLTMNRGTARILMAGVLFIMAWVVASIVGTAMGGM